MGTVRFVLRTDKPDKQGLFPIQLVYQLGGEKTGIDPSKKQYFHNRKYFKTEKKVLPENWDAKEQEAVFYKLDKNAEKLKAHLNQKTVNSTFLLASKEVKEINDSLASLRKEIVDIEDRFKLNKVVYSASMVIDSLKESKGPLTKKDAPSNELFDFIDKYIIEHSGTREKGSLIVYKSLKTYLAGFQIQKRRKVTFDKIDYSFFTEFQNYLLSLTTTLKDGTRLPRLNNTTIAKQLSTIKTFLTYARKHGISVSDRYKDFTIKRENLDVIALTGDEYDKLFYLDLSGNKSLSQIRDVFCFSCETGLRYSDLKALKWENIKGDEIQIVVKKTKQPHTIPLNDFSQAILNRYKHSYRPLPVISSQKTNDYIKELCKKAGINSPEQITRFRGAKREDLTYPKYELITIHTGRKTFCTLSLERGMNAEEVMSISGHKDYKSFKRYVKITEQRKKVVMRSTRGQIKMPHMKAV